MNRGYVVAGSIAGFLAVAAGAFGAHALRQFAPDRVDVFETAARYQFYHALAVLLLGLAGDRLPAAGRGWVCRAFLLGMVLFSGSLYLLGLTGLRWLGAITPLGGAAFLLGWAGLAWIAWRAAPGAAHPDRPDGRTVHDELDPTGDPNIDRAAAAGSGRKG